MTFFADLRDFDLAKDLSLRALMTFFRASHVLFLALLVLHLCHAVTLATFQVLRQSFKFDGFGLMAVLKQALGFLLRQSLLVFVLQELFLSSAWNSRSSVSQVSAVLADRR